MWSSRCESIIVLLFCSYRVLGDLIETRFKFCIRPNEFSLCCETLMRPKPQLMLPLRPHLHFHFLDECLFAADDLVERKNDWKVGTALH